MSEKNDMQMDFNADVSRLLDIVAHALYTNQDVFLRELISNAADACDRLRYDALQNSALITGDAAFNIKITADAPARILSVADNGIGMSREELIENLGTIAKSGTAALMKEIEAGKSESPLKLIGQFGVGFYASYMVAGLVTVISRKAGTDESWVWESDGRSGFTVREATGPDKEKLDGARGTVVLLQIKDSASEFLIDEKIRQTALHYSDHVNVPIFVGDNFKVPVNTSSAIWARSKSDITKEQYTEFYRALTHGFDEPLLTSHWRAEGKIEYTALLFVPTLRPWDLYDPSRKHAVKLYVRRVFITDALETLMYPWLRFVRGVIDTEDLPLNISRESLQFNPVLAKIRSSVTKRILSDLNKLAKDDAPAFIAFWGQFGAALKEGLYDAYEHREEIFKICRFFSTHENGEKFVSLDDYMSRMQEGQDEIYYLSGEKIEAMVQSPQIEGFKVRGIEVLFFTDTIDDFWLQQIPDYQGKKFKSVTKGDVAWEQDKAEPNASGAALVQRLYDVLKEQVSEVRLSKRLTDSAVCLIAPETGVDMHMERVLKIHQNYAGPAKPVLEINAGHTLIKKLESMTPDADDFGDAALALLDQAKIIQGQPLTDAAGFARRMSAFIEKSI